RAVVKVAAVSGIPLVGARHRARGRQREAGGRGVGAVAVDRDRLGVFQDAVQEQLEGDGAGGVGAARERGRVLEDLGRIAQRDACRVGGGGDRRLRNNLVRELLEAVVGGICPA